nr:GH3 auxin-responsive promoter family protein [bacterium]
MNFEQKLKALPKEELWQEYCGFLDLSLEEYMLIQRRLLQEQMSLWAQSGLGKRLLKGKVPATVEEFRQTLPLTDYSDYADVLLEKRIDLLPEEPVVWMQTTWEGGKHPVKLAPYTRGMIDTARANVLAIMMLSTGSHRGDFHVTPGDHALFGLAPLPYVTGLFPLLLDGEFRMQFFPPVEEAHTMSFGQRNKKGFEMGLKRGLDFFFGLSSVVGYITESFSAGKKGGVKVGSYSMPMLGRLAKASYRSKRDGVAMKPGDVFKLKSFVCAGTDTRSYKPMLEKAWGIRPMEVAAGTEPSILGTETWNKNGLVLFPDACFYEFIPEQEMLRTLEDSRYQPHTCLMDELIVNQNYELVITSFKGGAFARYRVGDMYRCVSMGGDGDEVRLPRLEFIDRIPTVIDIAGFTRITEQSIAEVIGLSGLPVTDWVAKKEYKENGRPYLHLYLELADPAKQCVAASRQLLVAHLSAYFTYYDADYQDLKKLLGIDPLEITLLRTGTFAEYRAHTGKTLSRMNPSAYDLAALVGCQAQPYPGEGGVH